MLEWSIEALRAVDAVRGDRRRAAGRVGRVAARGHDRRARRRASLAVGAGRAERRGRRSGDRPRRRAPARDAREVFQAALDELERHGCDAVIAAAPVADTIKQVDADGVVTRTLERSALWAVQTPQVFRRAALERALERARRRAGRARPTTPGSSSARAGRCGSSPRRAENLKVTTPGDLQVAELALRERAGV